MTALIVGGDYVESLKKAMSDRGMERINTGTGASPEISIRPYRKGRN